MGPFENGNAKFHNRIYQKKKPEKEKTEKMLQEQLNNLLAQSEHCKNKPALRIKIQTVQSRLKRITEQKVKGAMMRSKARWTEYGEKNTRYFLNLEKRKAEKKRIVELYLEDGTVTENQYTILKEE